MWLTILCLFQNEFYKDFLINFSKKTNPVKYINCVQMYMAYAV